MWVLALSRTCLVQPHIHGVCNVTAAKLCLRTYVRKSRQFLSKTQQSNAAVVQCNADCTPISGSLQRAYGIIYLSISVQDCCWEGNVDQISHLTHFKYVPLPMMPCSSHSAEVIHLYYHSFHSKSSLEPRHTCDNPAKVSISYHTVSYFGHPTHCHKHCCI